MEDVLVSIIVPVFNIGEYVSECIESIQNQTYKKLQIILVDDGSTDASGKVCDEYALTDKRIYVIHKENGGLVSARKAGLEKATGDYIGFVDGDDYILPSMYEELLKEMQRNDADWVHSGFITEDKKSIPFERAVIEFSEHKDRENFIKTAVFGAGSYMAPSIWSKLFKNGFIKKCYSKVPNNAQYGEDLINLCICIENCDKLVLLDKAYYYYRYRKDSITKKVDLSSIKNIFRYYMNLCNVIVRYECYDELEKLIMKHVCGSIISKIKSIADNDFGIERYYYAHPDRLQGKKIIIYGAGVVGRNYYAQIRRYTECDIVAWVDAHPERYHYPYIRLYGIEVLDTMEFDVLVIAVKKEKLAEEIGAQLRSKGIEKEKIFWSVPKLHEIWEHL